MPHQQQAINTYPKRWGIFWGTGVGKTYLGLGLIERSIDLDRQSAIVICPKIVKSNWQYHIKEQGMSPEDHGGYGVHVFTKEDLVFKTKEAWDVENVEVVLADEAHFHLGTKIFTNRKRERLTIAGALKKLLEHHQPNAFHPMTATPYRSSPWDLYGMWTLVHGKPPMNYNTFRARYFWKAQWGWKPKTDRDTRADIDKMYKKCGTFLKSDDVFELPPTLDETVYFQPTSSAIKGIEELEEFDPAIRYGKIYQILNGTLKGNEYEEHKEFSCDKVDWVLDYQENNDENIMIVCRHTLEIDRYKRLFEEKGVVVYVISGASKPDFPELNADGRRYVVIGQAQSLVGFDIMNVDTMIFHSMSFSFVDLSQSMGRITRGQSVEDKDHLKYYYLQIPGTIDAKVTRTVRKHEDFNIALYAE